MSSFLSTLCEQTIGRFLPINIDRLRIFGRRPVRIDDNDPFRQGSCPTNPPESTTDRTKFGVRGCVVYGYPSTGGVLIKGSVDLVDMVFLSLPRFHEAQRSPSAEEEDRFCNLLRQIGATWWPSKEERIGVDMGSREKTAEEKKVLVFGWPVDGVGVWVLRFASDRQVPRDLGRMYYAVNMEERIQIMKEYGAEFVEDVSQVEELRDTL
ncbi:hypothetical protein ASPCAL12831 [Aspergillus calidoustus]|uniref:Uncharacterized protein n=1 Tax=Aspergillus calidoustus TaxID=454130 RepID=A0A0U5GBK7_ASPCI|nr:hypothetical protein ASPCAL12831 [Aspergillus calidoustus]